MRTRRRGSRSPAAQSEHIVAELGWDKLRFRAPVHHGDTIEAFTEVVEAGPSTDHPEAGVLRFKHWGRRQDAVVVLEGERTALIERREPGGLS